MERKTFLLYNILGASTWVTAIAVTGFAFGTKFSSLFDYVEKASWGVSGALLLTGYLV